MAPTLNVSARCYDDIVLRKPWYTFLLGSNAAFESDLEPIERRRIHERFRARLESRRRRLIVLVLAGVVSTIVIPAIVLTIAVIIRIKGQNPAPLVGVIVAVTSAVMTIIWVNIFSNLTRQTYRTSMRDAGHDICVGCGYALDGHDEGAVCPECGREEQPPLGSRDPCSVGN